MNATHTLLSPSHIIHTTSYIWLPLYPFPPSVSPQHKGNTPLHFCFTYGYGDTLGAYLTSKGADPGIRNNYGLTCYEGLGGNKGGGRQ